MRHGLFSIDRAVRALLFELRGGGYRSVVVWIEGRQFGVRLVNPAHSWMTLRKGDELIVNGKLEVIEQVRLYDVVPGNQCDRLVDSGSDWLAEDREP